IHEVYAGKSVVERDLLRSKMFLDGDWVVGAALDRGIVRHHDDLATRHATDAGHESCTRRVVVVEVPGGERRELEERRTGIEQPIDPLTDGQLALRPVPLECLRTTAFAD